MRVLLALLSFVPSLLIAQDRITPERASNYIGKTVVVEGVVAQVSYAEKSNTTFLNFCAPFPRHCFSAVIFRSAQSRFPDVRDIKGKAARVSGRVRVYRGKPEIILSRREQLDVR